MLEWVREQDACPASIPVVGPEEMIDDYSDWQDPDLLGDYDPWSGL